MIERVRTLVLGLLVFGLALLPFVALRRPWAVRLWGRAKLLIVLYVLAVLVAAAVALVFRWDDIYG